MMDEEDVLEGARSIRPFLPELLGDEADRTDTEIAELLGRATAGERVDHLILRRLREDASTREWLAEFLRAQPSAGAMRGFQPVAGHGEPVAMPRYECPHGDYVWYRRAAGQPVPDCPTHGVPLSAADAHPEPSP